MIVHDALLQVEESGSHFVDGHSPSVLDLSPCRLEVRGLPCIAFSGLHTDNEFRDSASQTVCGHPLNGRNDIERE